MTASTEPSASSPQGRIPDFFIVGHAKSGTTALYEMLRRHPQIFMPERGEEPWFFATDMRPRFRPSAGAPPETLEEYLKFFEDARPEQIVGERSSSYLWSRTAARGIADVRPDARIIAILREPASFLRSLHLQLLQNHVETQKDFRKAMALEGARREGRHVPRRSHRPQMLQYADHVRYAEQLRRYDALFSPEQMLVLIYDDFRSDNEATVRKILRFLEVDDTAKIDVMDANPSLLIRSQQLDKVMHAVSVGRDPVSRTAKTLVKAVTPRQLRRDSLTVVRRRVVYGRPQSPDEEFMLELRHRFKPQVVAVSEYLDRDLVSLWGYDELG